MRWDIFLLFSVRQRKGQERTQLKSMCDTEGTFYIEKYSTSNLMGAMLTLS